MDLYGDEVSAIMSALQYSIHNDKELSKKNYIRRQNMFNEMDNDKYNLSPIRAKIIINSINYYRKNNIFTNQDEAMISQAYRKIMNYYQKCYPCYDMTVDEVLDRLNDIEKLSKHTFVREALDIIFKGCFYDKNDGKITFTNLLSGLSLAVLEDFSYYHKKIICIPLELQKKQSKLLQNYQKKGLKYALVSDNYKNGRKMNINAMNSYLKAIRNQIYSLIYQSKRN